MRIVQVVETLEVGGLERVAVDLALQQQAAGHAAMLYCIVRTGPLAQIATTNSITVRCFDKLPGPSFKSLYSLTRALYQDTPDVVHTHQAGIHHYAALAGYLAGVPAIVTTRHSPSTSLLRPYQDRYFRWVLPLTSNVAVVSQATLDFLVSCGFPASKMRVIRNGISVAKYRAKSAKPSGRKPLIRFGTVARFVPEKAHSVLLRAFGLLLQSVPAAELRIIGYGPLFEDTHRLVDRLGLANHVHLAGRTDDVPAVLSELDVFVLSSVSEGLPLVILEAMAAGLPIVSTRVGGIPEVAIEGQVAWYCEPGSAESLSQAMLQAATSSRLCEMGCTAARLAQEQLDVSVMQKKYEAMYLESMRRKRQ